jgi:hypothetical protein
LESKTRVMLHYLPSIRWSALLLALQQSDGIGGVLRETFRSRRTPPDPLHLPDRRSLESRKPDNQIPYALVLLNELATLAPLAVHNGGAFCELLIAARKKAGLTQQEVARRLKRPQSFVAKFEGGERRLDVVEFLAVAKAIGADPVRIIRKLMHATG